MISMKQPSLVLHSCDVPGFKYQMNVTWNMPVGASSSDVVFWILAALDRTPENRLENVIINCHGGPGRLRIGGKAAPRLTIHDVGLFEKLRTKEIGTVWLVACDVAQGGIGEYFCSKLAQALGCDVIAANEEQKVESAFMKGNSPYGSIDDFEGTAYRFSPSGTKEVWSIRE